MNNSIVDFKKQDEKIHYLLLFHSIIVVILSIVFNYKFKDVDYSSVVLSSFILILIFLVLFVELFCVFRLIQAISYKSIIYNNMSKEIVGKFWDETSMIDIYKKRGNKLLDNAKHNERVTSGKINIIKDSIRFTKVTIIGLGIIGLLLFIETGQKIWSNDGGKTVFENYDFSDDYDDIEIERDLIEQESEAPDLPNPNIEDKEELPTDDSETLE